jgi:hypothetical protein
MKNRDGETALPNRRRQVDGRYVTSTLFEVSTKGDPYPTDRYKDEREIQYHKRIKIGKKTKERRVYTRVHTPEFKAEAAALAWKWEKPADQIARDLWGQ